MRQIAWTPKDSRKEVAIKVKGNPRDVIDREESTHRLRKPVHSFSQGVKERKKEQP